MLLRQSHQYTFSLQNSQMHRVRTSGIDPVGQYLIEETRLRNQARRPNGVRVFQSHYSSHLLPHRRLACLQL